ncbi:MAG: hypothetical protein GTO45_30180 [Candidatus Aminicenantes bacterium]|nr:hypothetical protein [Candidatus Aminicenantes bacterium]NIM83061.1 hypothetical protein [Candidatus Aminicenantes bacterium]NIN22440.1 hypothetical protein [Candidatus Aminicenantes bacterium]NIN46208.1 hypothetical protein [Candidatus Aminicenantes bacterium]NIN89045.1 hypothetical protein [Candidatus Aminicenantes bacterium]
MNVKIGVPNIGIGVQNAKIGVPGTVVGIRNTDIGVQSPEIRALPQVVSELFYLHVLFFWPLFDENRVPPFQPISETHIRSRKTELDNRFGIFARSVNYHILP